MSVRAKLVRALLRLCKTRDNVPPDLAAIRRNTERIKWIMPNPPRGTTAWRVTAGGVPAVRVAAPTSRGDRHIFYLHGGAFVYGSPSLYRDFLWRISAASGAHVLCPDYRLAPEHPFPAAMDDAVNAYRALLAEGADPRRIAIAGDSAGGGLTFSTLLRLRDEREPLPAAAVALSPWTDLTLSGESFRRNAAADPMLNPRHAQVFADWYLNGAEAGQPYASPLFGDLAGLPPSLILVGDDEILLDDAARLVNRLHKAGCAAELDVGPRMPHVWPVFARFVPEARTAVTRIGDFVRRHASAA
jgi:epsilon-lactone hydrolase